ncbi:hypothetical protein RCAQUAPHINA_56 [Rhodobacter phage RcAquaphina]|nr:hypothetical protein RCAQUAPHINA_56 [Rhodobacter phage RcAquaphina]
MIETEYRGHRIIYSENGEDWYCPDIEKSNAPTLSKVKAKIDRMYLDMRKRAAFSGFEIGSYQGPKFTPTVIVDYIEEKVERSWNDPKVIRSRKHVVAAVAQRGYKEKAARRHCDLQEIAPDTPETHAAFQVAEARWADLEQARKAYENAVAAIPRVTIEDIADLVKVSAARLGGEE